MYEYEVISISFGGANLNKYAKEGWRLVAVVNTNGNTQLGYLERKITEGDK